MKRYSYLTILLLVLCFTSQAQKWQKIIPPGYNFLRFTSFTDANHGWMMASDSLMPVYQYHLIHTRDGAETFEKVYTFSDTMEYQFMQMTDTLHGFLRCSPRQANKEYFLATYNGGYTWNDITDTALYNSGPFFSNACYNFLNKNTGFFGGINCIYKTINGGLNWESTNTPVIVESGNTRIFKINKFFFLNDSIGWAGCSILMDWGCVLSTRDGGLNWFLSSPFAGDIYNLHFADSLIGATTGGDWYYQNVLLTEDNFSTYSHLYQNHWPQLPDAIYYENDSTIWLSGWPAYIYKSIDRGATFFTYDSTHASSDLSDWIYDFKFFDSTKYAFARNFLLKMTDTLNTAIHKPDFAINRTLLLSPNPVQNSCKITLPESNSKRVDIKIYSLNGALHKQVKPSRWLSDSMFELSLADLNPGIYLLEVNTDKNYYISKLIKQP
jgi:hypothetical protein